MNKPNRPYQLVSYDPKWPKIFAKERNILSGILGDVALYIEHVGSTSVEGMLAKPQIDVMVVVKNFSDVDEIRAKLENAGFAFHGDYIGKSEQYFTRDTVSGERLVSVHMFEQGNLYIADMLMFRDYLRTHPEERNLYAEVKRRAYNNGKNNRHMYSEIKTPALEEMQARAVKAMQAGNEVNAV